MIAHPFMRINILFCGIQGKTPDGMAAIFRQDHLGQTAFFPGVTQIGEEFLRRGGKARKKLYNGCCLW